MPSQAEEPQTADLGPLLPHLSSLLSSRTHPKTLCPSEVARSLSPTELRSTGFSSWRDLMPDLRRLCFQMRDDGELEILQRGEVVSSEQGMEDTRGPIRIRRGIKY